MINPRDQASKQIDHQQQNPFLPPGLRVIKAPVVALKEPPRTYGWWTSTVDEVSRNHARMLIVFSGRKREGDLAHQMARLGWLVRSLDTVLPTPTDLTDDKVWDEIKKDLDDEYFEAGWIATPCGTFSPLREKPPGPRPRVIRTVDHITGIPNPTLGAGEPGPPAGKAIAVVRD